MIHILWTGMIFLAIACMGVALSLAALSGTETGAMIDRAIAERIKARKEGDNETD